MPTFPENLPPPTEIIESRGAAHYSPDDLETNNDILKLLHDLYWFPEDENYLFRKYKLEDKKGLKARLENHGIELKKTEFYFYKHPKPAYKNDFVRILPNEAHWDWEKKTIKGQMYFRTAITLAPWKRKEMDIRNTAEYTKSTLNNDSNVFEFKPSFHGVSINLKLAWKKIITFFKNRNNKKA